MIVAPELYFDVDGKAALLMAGDSSLTLESALDTAKSSFNGTACQISFLSVGIWWALFSQITFAKLPNKIYGAKVTKDVVLSGYREIRKVYQELKKTDRLKKYLIAFFFFNTGVQTVMYMAANFAAKEIKSVGPNGEDVAFQMENLILTILIIQLVGIVGAYLFSWLSKKLGNLRALMLAVVAWILLCIGAYFVVYEFTFYALAAGVGMVMGGVQSLSRSTYSKFLPDTKDEASYFSFFNVCYYIGTVVGTFGFGYVLDVTGNIRMSILLVSVFFVIGFWMLLNVPKEERVLERT
jgi:MFS transporter, UMF1 family